MLFIITEYFSDCLVLFREGAAATYLCAAATYLMDYLKIRLNSASVEVEVEVEVEAELGNKYTLVLYPASPKPIFR